jgi:tetratricopeptide (TPR) repeat protein
MSKEIALSFLFVIPFSLWFFKIGEKKHWLISIIPALGASILFIAIRVLVLGQFLGEESTQLMNNPFYGTATGDKYATIFMTLGMYLKLLFFPHPLTWDYYPFHIAIISWGDWRALLSLLIYLALGVFAILGLKKRKLFSWVIWYYFATIAMTSNLLINIGAFMSERFLFFPSVAFAIIVAHLMVKYLPKFKNGKIILAISCLLIISLYAVKSVTRNRVWESSFSLFQNDVKLSPNSAKGNSSYGSELYSKAEKISDTTKRNEMMRQAVPYLEKAIEIHPIFIEPLVRLGNIRYIVFHDVPGMMDYYIRVLKASPENVDFWGNAFGVLTQNVDNPEFEINTWNRVTEINPNHIEVWRELGDLYMNRRYRPDSAIIMLKKAELLNPNDIETLRMLGFAYGTMNRPIKARSYFNRLISIKPKDAEALKFIGISYGIEGDHIEAIEYLEKSLVINPNDGQAKMNLEIARKSLEK